MNVPACTSPHPASHYSSWLQSWQTNKRPQVFTWSWGIFWEIQAHFWVTTIWILEMSCFEKNKKWSVVAFTVHCANIFVYLLLPAQCYYRKIDIWKQALHYFFLIIEHLFLLVRNKKLTAKQRYVFRIVEYECIFFFIISLQWKRSFLELKFSHDFIF